jgi:hypothetical protein
MEKIKVGTLIKDMGKLGVITRVIQSGNLNIDNPIIKWRLNYEIYYSDGTISIIGGETLKRLMEKGEVEIL